MISLHKQDGETLYGIKEYLLDSPQDIEKLPTNVRVGSSALVISTGDLYIFNGNEVWVPFAGIQNGGNGSIPPTSGDYAGPLTLF